MGFSCENEIVISGGTGEERGRAASLLLAAETIDEDSVSRKGLPEALVLRCESVDGLPEEEVLALSAQFPELDVLIVYFSKDGEFYGYTRSGPASAAESADFEEGTLDEVGRRHDGDGIAFVRERYGLGRSG
jgi:hypothetical protein